MENGWRRRDREEGRVAGTAAKIGGEGKVLEEGEGPVGRVDNLEPPRDDPLSIEIQKMVESKEGGGGVVHGENVPARRVNAGE